MDLIEKIRLFWLNDFVRIFEEESCLSKILQEHTSMYFFDEMGLLSVK